ncbi:MAG TPA: type VI secretion system baseplate subunit TssE [Microvirga sp.]|jgi:type VI secretion system protein ImpF|nr:type VI secretion system baseplate subunit TssE [Microvirga sp.]
MIDPDRKNRLASPFMFAFREANRQRDARKPPELADERRTGIRSAAARAAITERALREQVAQDLVALVNTVNLESTLDLDEAEHVRRSILNFGLPDIAHRSIDEQSVNDIKDEIATALVQYEPRLAKGSVLVQRDADVDVAELKVRYTIHADLVCDPVNVPLEFVADVEVDTGKILISRL